MRIVRVLACVFVAGNLSADPSVGDEQSASSKPTMMENHVKQGQERNEGDMMPGYNAPGRVDVTGGYDFFSSASFIYWQPRPSNIVIGTRDQLTDAFTSPSTLRVDETNIAYDYQFRPGFKVLVGMFFKHDNWGGLLEYTWLWTKIHDGATQSLPGHITSAWLDPANTAALGSSHNNWTFRYNCGDASTFKTFYFGTKLLFTPYTGARFVYLKQKMDVDMLAFPSQATTMLASVSSEAHSWLLGPRGGLKLDWLFATHLKMIAETSVSLLFSHYHLHYRQVGNFSSRIENVTAVKNTSRYYMFVPNVDVNFGFGWGSYVNADKQHIDLVLRYDFVYYWNGSQMAPTAGDLTLQGLTATFKLDF